MSKFQATNIDIHIHPSTRQSKINRIWISFEKKIEMKWNCSRPFPTDYINLTMIFNSNEINFLIEFQSHSYEFSLFHLFRVWNSSNSNGNAVHTVLIIKSDSIQINSNWNILSNLCFQSAIWPLYVRDNFYLFSSQLQELAFKFLCGKNLNFHIWFDFHNFHENFFISFHFSHFCTCMSD